ncbi:MAG: carbohydrate ABC transporter permease [Verrucomicrobia bacterium]|nr:MAG: carbohydrate ABC transporter permease [Verrucomicrobiota bacterium]
MGLLETFGIHDSLWALILPYTAQNLPVAILLFAAFFASLPGELEEAARLEGVGTARFCFSILLPVARPAVATIVVISCLSTWNEFLMAMLFIVDPGMKTLPVGMIAFEQSHNTDYPALLAGLSLISLPLLLLYGIFNRQIIRGAIAGVRRGRRLLRTTLVGAATATALCLDAVLADEHLPLRSEGRPQTPDALAGALHRKRSGRTAGPDARMPQPRPWFYLCHRARTRYQIFAQKRGRGAAKESLPVVDPRLPPVRPPVR